MCHRCGKQTDLHIVDLSVYENSKCAGCQYIQTFNLCSDCLDMMFDRLSVLLSDSRKWELSEEDD